MRVAHDIEDSRKFITLSQAAKMAGRSYAWAYDRAADGRFEARRLPNGRITVAADSVARQIRGDHRGRGHLRLVVDNTK